MKKLLLLLALACTTQAYAQPWAQQVKDIYPGRDSSDPGGLLEYNDKLYFYANDGVHGYELWYSDGTAAGTQMAFDYKPGPDNGAGGIVGIVKGKMRFLSFVNPYKYDWLESDGTLAGTHKLSDIDSMSVYNTAIWDTLIFFNSYAVSTHSQELWRTDGTDTGTYPITNFDKGTGNYVSYKNKLHFSTSDINTNKSTPWVTDGTVAGTYPLKQMDNAGGYTEYKGLLYFTGIVEKYSDDGYDIWRTDGTEAGTVVFKDVDKPAQGEYAAPYNYYVYNNKLLYYLTKPNSSGYRYEQLWITDEDPAHAIRLVDSFYWQSYLYTFNEKLFFCADSSIWISDGTRAGTKVYSDGVYFNYLNTPIWWNDKLFFWGYKKNSTGAYDYNLYWTDGESGDVKPVIPPPFERIPFSVGEQLILAGNVLYFTANVLPADTTGYELWRVTDFPNGVPQVSAVPGSPVIYPNPAGNVLNVLLPQGMVLQQALVTDIQGRNLLKAAATPIDISQLPPGKYQLQLHTTQGIQTSSFVKE